LCHWDEEEGAVGKDEISESPSVDINAWLLAVYCPHMLGIA